MLKRAFKQLCFIIILCAAAIPVWAQDAKPVQTEPRHPGIFINHSRLVELTKLIQRLNPWWINILDWSREPARNNILIEDGPSLALSYLMISQNVSSSITKTQGDLAKACALKAVDINLPNDVFAASDLVAQVALTLDWAWDAFSETERKKVANWLVNQTSRFSKLNYSCFTGENAALFRMMTLAGLAADGQDSRAAGLWKQALQTRYKEHLLPCLQNLGKGGGWFEDVVAGSRAGLHIIESAAAFKTAKGLDLITGVDWYKDRMLQLMFTALPRVQRRNGLSYFPIAPGGDRSLDPVLSADYSRLQLIMLTALLPDEPSAGWAQAWVLHSQRPAMINRHVRALEFVWLQPLLRQEPLVTAPRVWLAKDAGRVYMRSDWSQRATWLKFSCGPHFAARQHLNAASLQLFKNEMLLPPGGAYDGFATSHALNYAARSIAQNTLRIIDPDEYSWQVMRAGNKPQGTYANDGGQRAFSGFDSKDGTIVAAPWTSSGWDQGESPYSKFKKLYELGKITATESKLRFQYAKGDATAAYQGSTNKARRVVRHVIHLLPGGPQDPSSANLVVVVDDVSLNRTKAQVRFVAHLPGKPEIPGAMQSIGPGRYQGKNNRIIYKGQTTNLEIISVMPQNPNMYVFGRKNNADAWVNGRNYPPKGQAGELSSWRVEFGSDPDGKSVRPMVTALIPAGFDDPPSPSIRPLPTASGNTAGLVVMDSAWPRVVVVKLGSPLDKEEMAYGYPAGRSRHLVAGLEPGAEYQVKMLENRIIISKGKGLTSSPAGLLAFVLEPQSNSKK